MSDRKSRATLKPLFVGRVTRIVFGIGTLVAVAILRPATLSDGATIGLVFLGVSFLIGGIMGTPGCELMAIPNLFVARGKRRHCF